MPRFIQQLRRFLERQHLSKELTAAIAEHEHLDGLYYEAVDYDELDDLTMHQSDVALRIEQLQEQLGYREPTAHSYDDMLHNAGRVAPKEYGPGIERE